jgi:hypothetical protein
MVTYHCTACHCQDTDNDRYCSEGPYARELACQAARRHLERCEGSPGLADKMETAAAKVSGAPPVGYAAHCATRPLKPGNPRAWSSCAEVRAARTAAARNRG